MKLSLTLILLFPLAGAAVNVLLGRLLPRRVVETVACAAIWGSFAAAVGAFAAYIRPERVGLFTWLLAFDFAAPFSVFIDPLSLVLTLMITFVCAVIHLYSVGYMKDDAGYVRYFAILNLFVFAMLVLVLAENLPLLYLGWEGVGFCSYGLIGFWYREKKNADAGRKAFIVTRIGDAALLAAVIWMFRLFHTVSIPELNSMGFLMPVGVVTALGFLLLGGAAGKSAQVPLMVWLPDAMAGPTPVSAQIHAATMVTAGVYLLARMSPLVSLSGTVMAAIATVGAVTAFYGATCALSQRDLKRVLAYSTISQIGYMTLAVGCGSVVAGSFHLLVHAFFKALLFLAAGSVIYAMHHEQDVLNMGGLRRSLPVTFWCFLAGALCLAGFPLTGGFFSKDAILAAAWERGGLYGGLFWLGLLTAYITAVYTFRLVYLVFLGPEREAQRPPRVMEWALVPLAFLGLFGGLLNLPDYLGGGLLARFLSPVPHQAGGTRSEVILQVVAAAVALAGWGTAHLIYGGERRRLRIAKERLSTARIDCFLWNGWYADRLYRFLFVRPYERLASFFWTKIDEGVIDDSLDRLAEGAGEAGRLLSGWTTGRISAYLVSFAGGAAAIALLFAWMVNR